MEKPKQHILSPRLLKKGEDKSYLAVEELADIIQHKECQNIALTGPYGSGKSSILRTLCTEYSIKKGEELNDGQQRYNFLSISLAAFHCDSDDDTKTNFEYSLLQQLFYAAAPDTVNQSRFKRIKHLRGIDIHCVAIRVILFIIALAVLFEPSSLRVESFYRAYSNLGVWWGNFFNIIGDIIAAGYILYCLYLFVSIIIKHIYNAKLTKLGSKEGVVEVPNTASAFNQHLEEIVYFFEATDYDVVVFEDIDRFKKPEAIFNKLREVNLLINNAHFCGEKRSIKFIYAIKDDIFTGELRTKFFDYIVSTAPIVNFGNAKNYLKTHIKEAGISSIDEQDLMNIGAFIGSMRELKNIVNELRQHKGMFGSNLKQSMLLAMIVYKNQYPKDYAGLHSNSGVLYKALQLKPMFANAIVKIYDGKISELKSQIEEKGSVYDENYDNNDPNAKIYAQIEDYQRLSIEMPHISLSNTLKRFDNAFDVLGIINEQCLSEYKKNSYYEANDDSSIDNYDKLCRFILFLLRSGYVDFSYENYITYFSPGALTETDNEFYLRLLSGIQTDADYSLNKVSELINKIDIEHFSSNLVLNYDLVEGLLERSNNQKLFRVLDNIIVSVNFNFLVDFYKNKGESDFILKLLNRWVEYLPNVSTNSKDEDRGILFQIFYEHAYNKTFSVNRLNEVDINILANNFGVLVECYNKLNPELLSKLLIDRNIVFKNIQDQDQIHKTLYNTIVDNYLYEINSHNIGIIVGVDFVSKSYTSVLNHTNVQVKEYLLNNIDSLHSAVPNSSTDEDINAIAYIVNSNLTRDIKISYLKIQQNCLATLDGISANNIPILYLTNTIIPLWINIPVDNSEEAHCLSNEVIAFIDRYHNELSKDAETLSQELKNWYSLALFYDNHLSIESHRTLQLAMTHTYTEGDISSLDAERLPFIVENNIIKYNSEYSTIIHDCAPEYLPTYIVNNFDDYLADVDDVINLDNSINTFILNSSLTLDQKINWMFSKSVLIVVDKFSAELARLICFYFNLSVTKKDNTDSYKWSIIFSALKICENWKIKIDLINSICKRFVYKREFVSNLIETLGGEYLKLNQLKMHPSFDDNAENITLIEYLDNKRHISSHEIKDGKIKVHCKYK